MDILLIVCVMLLAFTCSYSLMGLVQETALRYQLLDIPNTRSSHQTPIPRAGGIAFVLTFLMGMLIFFKLHLFAHTFFFSLLLAPLLIALLGFIDDLRSLSVISRASIHAIVAFTVILGLQGKPLDWQNVCLFVVSGFSLMWSINLYNFMDGVDGLAASEALFLCGATAMFLYLSGDQVLLMIPLLLFGAVTAFLIANWSPARIFMGDVGSGFLGCFFGVLACMTIQHRLISLPCWIILGGVFLTDATITLIKRMLNREPWYLAHRSHLYQRLAQHWGSHALITGAVWIINLGWLLPWSLVAWYWPQWAWACTIIALLPLAIGVSQKKWPA